MTTLRTILLATLLFCCSIALAQEYYAISAKEVAAIDTFYRNYIIEDRYRWLEDLDSPETQQWTKEQSALAKKYLNKCSNNVFSSIDKYSYAEYNHLTKKGKYYFTYAYYHSLRVPALFYQSSLKAEPRLLVDPNYISRKDLINLTGYWVSKDSRLMAYQFSRNGSDWQEAKVITLKLGIHQKDHLTGLKFSDIAWQGNGFYYSTFSQADRFGQTLGQKVFYHQIGKDQQGDSLIFMRNNPAILFDYKTTADERFFVLKEINPQKGLINIFYADAQADQPQLRPLLTNLKDEIDILDSHQGKLIAITFHQANNGRIVAIDPKNPAKWQEIAPEFSESRLLEAIPFSDRIVAIYQVNQRPIITLFSYTGEILHSSTLPIGASIAGFSGDFTDEELFYYLQSYTVPPIVYKFNIGTFEKKLTERTAVTFSFEDIVYEEVEYLSKDGVPISMLLVYKKGLKLNGRNPTILMSYGGFGIVAQPAFEPGLVHFITQGGLFAFASIRGGGEKGVAWSGAGKGRYKQNSFDDFIAAAEFLIAKNYTTQQKLAITGVSNGGLVAAAAAIQRPDLFKAVVPVVAPLDMLRFEKFTVGHWHKEEYGSVEDSVSFTHLKAYSPYHNIEEATNYPAMLVITSENDDRVPPFHSYKFVARLQNRKAQSNPILLKIEKRSGHAGASTLLSSVQEKADLYGFVMHQLMKD